MFESLAGLGDGRCRAGARLSSAPTRRLRSMLADRARESLSVYQDNSRLVAENERLLDWQQAALKLAAENAAAARPPQADSRARGNLRHCTGDREFRRRLCAQPDGQRRDWERGGARPSRGDRRRPRRAGVRGRKPRRASTPDHRSELARAGGRRRARSSGRCSPATIPSVRACTIWMRAPRSRSATESSPRDRAASSRRDCRSASSHRSTGKRLGSSLTSSCRRSNICGSSIMGLPTALPQSDADRLA